MHTSYFSIFQEGKEKTKKSDEHDSKKIMDYELRPRLNRADENTTEEATTLITTSEPTSPPPPPPPVEWGAKVFYFILFFHIPLLKYK